MARKLVDAVVVLGAMVAWSVALGFTFASVTALTYLATISNLSRLVVAASGAPRCADAPGLARPRSQRAGWQP